MARRSPSETGRSDPYSSLPFMLSMFFASTAMLWWVWTYAHQPVEPLFGGPITSFDKLLKFLYLLILGGQAVIIWVLSTLMLIGVASLGIERLLGRSVMPRWPASCPPDVVVPLSVIWLMLFGAGWQTNGSAAMALLTSTVIIAFCGAAVGIILGIRFMYCRLIDFCQKRA